MNYFMRDLNFIIAQKFQKVAITEIKNTVNLSPRQISLIWKIRKNKLTFRNSEEKWIENRENEIQAE